MSESMDDVELRRLEALGMPRDAIVPARLVALLSDVDWRVRKQAAETASESLLAQGVLPLLVDGLLQPDDVGLRNASVEAFARAAPALAPQIARALEDALARSPRTARKFVAAALVGAGEGALSPLSALVRDEDVMTASCALEAVATLARRGVAATAVEPLLIAALSRTEPVLRLAALDGLIAIGSEIDASHLAPSLDDAISRPSALRVLARARSTSVRGGLDDVTRLLLATLPHPRSTALAALALANRSDPELQYDRRAFADPSTRPALVAAFAALDDAAISEIAGAIDSRSPEEARALARLSLEAGELRLLPAVVELGARAELDPACRDALVALGELAVPPLLALVRSRATDDVRAASWALEAASELASPSETLEGASPAIADELRSLARSLLAQGEEVGARAAAATLARWGDAADARALASRVAAYGSSYEAAAASAVGSIAVRASDDVRATIPERVGRRTRSSQNLAPVNDLRSQLASDDPELRASALESVAVIETLEELDLVALSLTDEDERVEVAATRALGRVRGKELSASAMTAARVASRSELPSVRAAALLTLSQLAPVDDAELAQEIASALSDASPSVVLAALRASRGRSDARLDRGLDAALQHADAEVVKEALLALPAGTSSHRARLFSSARRLVAHEHWSVRARAAEVLGRLRSLAGDPLLEQEITALLHARRASEPDELVLRALAAAAGDSSARAERG